MNEETKIAAMETVTNLSKAVFDKYGIRLSEDITIQLFLDITDVSKEHAVSEMSSFMINEVEINE